MNRRPFSITVVGWIFIGVGAITTALTLLPLLRGTSAPGRGIPSAAEFMVALPVRFLALVCGVFVLRGANWARWTLTAWLAFHLFISIPHSVAAFLVHGALLAAAVYLLFRPAATAYFRRLK